MQHGVTEELLDRVHDWRTAAVFDQRERWALDFTERFVTDPGSIDDAFVAALHDHFDDAEIVDLAVCAAKYLGMGRVVKVLELDHVCPMPERSG
jgi:alkylhydroperoxidase family enzyme